MNSEVKNFKVDSKVQKDDLQIELVGCPEFLLRICMQLQSKSKSQVTLHSELKSPPSVRTKRQSCIADGGNEVSSGYLRVG